MQVSLGFKSMKWCIPYFIAFFPLSLSSQLFWYVLKFFMYHPI
jgi:hypothetical protein